MFMKILKYDFTPHQPYLEYNNVYYSYKPDYRDELFGIVWEVYQVDNFDFNKTLAFPDICADIMVFYEEDGATCYFMGGTRGLRGMESLSFFKKIRAIFGVKFCSGALGNLFGAGACDTSEESISGYDALINGRDTVDRLCQAQTFTDRWNIIKDYLCGRIDEGYEIDPLVSYVAKTIVVNHGNIKVQELEKDTGYSNRYLRKKVNMGIGLPMKAFGEIVRFQWSYHLYRQAGGNMNLVDLALQSGYYDQSHMNMNYKKLTGFLPKDIITLYEPARTCSMRAI